MSKLSTVSLEADKVIRGVCLFNSGTKAALTTMLEVFIIDTHDGAVLSIIKRLSAPRLVMPIPNQHYLLVHFSDNYCILYDTFNYEPIYTILGMPNDHKGIKPSADGKHLLYANNTALQMWSIGSCQI